MHTEVRRTKSVGIKVTNVENGERGSAVSLALCPVKGIVCVCVRRVGIRSARGPLGLRREGRAGWRGGHM